jgi:hypothetical protein
MSRNIVKRNQVESKILPRGRSVMSQPLVLLLVAVSVLVVFGPKQGEAATVSSLHKY